MQFIDLKSQQDAIRSELNQRIAAVLEHGQYILGPEVIEMEGVLADYAGVRHCVSVSSGTEALLIAMMAQGIGPGDEVITTPFTFVATAEMIALIGATPVFVDVEADTANIDAGLIEQKLTNRTKAIMPVSLYGQVADMTAINSIAANHGGIRVIEDAAQSFGALYEGRRSCGLSTIGCTSFFPSKPLGCYGDGGAIFCDDDELAAAFREIRVHGQKQRYLHTRIGVGGRMDTLQCAIVLAKWTKFEWEVQRRVEIGQRYDRLIAERVPDAAPIRVRPGRTSVYAQYTVLVENREKVRSALQQAGIPTAVHYPVPLNEQPAYRHFASEPTPKAAALGERVLSLPMGPYLTEVEQERVVDELAVAVR